MARSIDAIQRDIEKNRNQLAQTLDELADRTNPKTLADDAKTQILEKLNDPQVKAVIGVAVAGVVGLIGFSIARGRRRKKEIERVRDLLLNV